jgi:two-component sensor histidine kinase
MIAGVRLPGWAVLRRLPVQIVLLMTLALFPLGMISLYQTGKVIAEARVLNRASLMERTIAAGAAERDLIQKALGAAQGLGMAAVALPAVECAALLTRFVAAEPSFAAARYHDGDGRLLCQSQGASLTAAPGADPGAVQIHVAADAEGAGLILVSHPVSRDGRHAGAVSIAIPAREADAALRPDPAETARDGLRIALINADGALLAASHGLMQAGAYLPRDLEPGMLLARSDTTFDGVAHNGDHRVFAISTVEPGRAALVGSWPVRAGLGAAYGPAALAPMVLPVLMWFAGMLVAWIGLQRLVVRHVTALRSGMRRYALGELSGGRIELDNPPAELREAERAFNRMVLLLAQADAQQEQDLRDKEVLLQEVHHRVKNNLQLIGSIINMQARKTDSAEAKRLLDSLRTRVRGLASMHRTFSNEPTMAAVGAGALVRALVADIASVSDNPTLRVDTDLQPVTLLPDQAVPLAMLLAETMTNAVKYAGPDSVAGTRITVALHQAPEGRATLSVTNTLSGPVSQGAEQQAGDGLGTRLIRAFEQQLGGKGQIVSDSQQYSYSLTFPIRQSAPETRP